MRVSYPIRTVAKLTSIAPDTLRAWERRYRAVDPEREGRARAYNQEEIQRLTLLRDAVANGHSIGKIAFLSDSALSELLQEDSRTGNQNIGHYAPATQGGTILQPVLAAVENFKPALAEEELTRLSLMLPPAELIHQVVLPLMRVTGERWHRGIWSIAHEHLLSGILRNLMGTLLRLNASRSAAARLLAATPAGDLHEFGILAGAILAASNGLEVIYLGPNLPFKELLFAARKTEADAVLIGITAGNMELRLREELAWLAREMPQRVALWLGGGPEQPGENPWPERFQFIEDFFSLEERLKRLKESGSGPILN
jgi:MerR family transcriptional regulator, light-induced transcriptional regulator